MIGLQRPYRRNEPASGAPLKWQKYLLLLRFGLLDESELRTNIRRYAWAERTRFLGDLGAECYSAATGDMTYLYVIKLVPRDGVGQLANLRLTVRPGDSRENILGLVLGVERFVTCAPQTLDEVWWCRTDVSPGRVSVAGRILFQTGGVTVEQIIEHVSKASPRLIETMSLGVSDVFYARACRTEWGFRWREEEIVSPISSDRVEETEQFRLTCLAIEAMGGRIRPFCCQLEDIGMNSYSLEYKKVGEVLSIIDWDTWDDRTVLERIL